MTPYELAKRYIQGRGHWTNDPHFIEDYLIAEINLTESKDGLYLSPHPRDRFTVALAEINKSYIKLGNAALAVSNRLKQIKPGRQTS